MQSDQDFDTPPPDGRRTFLRVLGLLCLTLVALILSGAALAPHASRIADVLLHQTLYRQWVPLRLDGDTVLPQLSTPVQTIQSYYQALYQGDSAMLERLTAGEFRAHMRQRLAYGSVAPAFTPYRSYVLTEMRSDRVAQVTEKFHLFWQTGVRFFLQRDAAGWQIVDLELLP